MNVYKLSERMKSKKNTNNLKFLTFLNNLLLIISKYKQILKITTVISNFQYVTD